MVEMTDNFEGLNDLLKKECCRCKIDRFGGLILGFGKKIEHNNLKLSDPFRGEWEIVVFDPSWELIIEGHLYNGKLKEADDFQNILRTIIGKKIIKFDKDCYAVILEDNIIFRVNKNLFDHENEDSYMHVFYMDKPIYSFEFS